MGNAQKSAKYLYLSLLGALAVLCIAAGIWWFIRGQQRAEPQYLLKDNGGHPALYTKAEKLRPVLGKLHTLKPNRLEAELLSGVPITDEGELQKRLEDYGL